MLYCCCYSSFSGSKKILLIFVSETTLVKNCLIIAGNPASMGFNNIPVKVFLDMFSQYILVIMILIGDRSRHQFIQHFIYLFGKGIFLWSEAVGIVIPHQFPIWKDVIQWPSYHIVKQFAMLDKVK